MWSTPSDFHSRNLSFLSISFHSIYIYMPMPVVGPVFIEGAQLRQELLRVERGGGCRCRCRWRWRGRGRKRLNRCIVSQRPHPTPMLPSTGMANIHKPGCTEFIESNLLWNETFNISNCNHAHLQNTITCLHTFLSLQDILSLSWKGEGRFYDISSLWMIMKWTIFEKLTCSSWREFLLLTYSKSLLAG